MDSPLSTGTGYNPPQNTTNRWDDGYPIGGNYYSNGIHQDYCSGPSQNICTYPDGINDGPYYIDAEYVYNNGANYQFYIITKDRYPLNAPFHATTAVPDFAVNIPPPPALSRGSSVSIIVTVTSLENYSDTVAINATSTAENMTISPSVTSINVQPGSRTSSVFRLTAGKVAPVGIYAVSIHASGSGLTHIFSATFSISLATQQPPVQPPPNNSTPFTGIWPRADVMVASIIVVASGVALALVVVTQTKRRKKPYPPMGGLG